MRLWYQICRLLCLSCFYVVFRGRVFNVGLVPLRGGVLLACNHQSFLDPVLATAVLRRECHFMARDTLFRNALFGWLISSLNAFPVKRGTADIGAIKETLRRLKSGALITVFPEGTRTPDGTVQPMHPGAVVIARRAGVPIVPVLVDGAFEAWPRHARLPRPVRIVVAYGEPIAPQQVASMTDEACVALIRERIMAMQARYGRPRPASASPAADGASGK